MSTDRRQNNKIPAWANRSANASGLNLDAGPYVGIIKNNIDPTRSGRLQIFIPDLGGDEDNLQNWRTVSYASPFFGATYQPEASKNTSLENVHQTYGMWMVPPDIGNEVLCTFVNGDPGRGYWFACINRHLSHGMVPGNGATSNPLEGSTVASEAVKNSLKLPTTPTLPAAEFNENIETNISDKFLQNNKAIHEYQAERLIQQGLDRDPTRGAVTSSSQRETPSMVFGISTPGRPVKDPADDPNYFDRLVRNEITEKDYAIRTRKGGHSFIMDDGDSVTGKDQLVRLRTATGHQLLMNDAERIIYLANSDGSVWLEFTGDGHIMAYAGGGISVRTEGDFNLHSDGNINLHAKKSLNIKAEKSITQDTPSMTIKANDNFLLHSGKIEIGSAGNLVISADAKGEFTADGSMTLWGSKLDLNTKPGAKVKDPGNLKPYEHPDTSRESDQHPWVSVPKSLSSIAPVAPSHEPWPRATGTPQGTSTVVSSAAPKTKSIGQGPAPSKTVAPVDCEANKVKTGTGGTTNLVTTAGLDPGPASAAGLSIKGALDPDWLKKPDVPAPTEGVGTLDQFQTQCLMAQIAFSESAWNYRAKNSLNYVGRYQTGAAVLVDQGYIKSDYFKQYRNGAVNNEGAWTGKDGITSLDDYFNNKAVQEAVMLRLLKSNYQTLLRIGGIKGEDDPCTVAGMLQVAHLLGAGGAKTWRKDGGGADANGTTGAVYFNKARYAIDVLASRGGGPAIG